MSVSQTFRYDIRPYAGFSDPGLPIGTYIGQAGLVGDASGGTVIASFIFQEEQDDLITELFSLEQLAIDTDAAAVDIIEMKILNMDNLSRNRAASPQIWRIATSAITTTSALSPNQNVNLPLWMGAPSLASLSGTGVLRFTFVNTDLRLYAITIQGYIWSARSILANGGPRRPVEGLFRS